MKQNNLKNGARTKKNNGRIEKIIKDFLTRIAEAAYEVALKVGFRGTFMTFLSDLEEALHEVSRKDKSLHPRRRGEAQEKTPIH